MATTPQLRFSPRKLIGYGIAAIIVMILGLNTWFTTEIGYNYLVQNTLTGSKSFYSDAGTHLKMPFFTRIHQYKQAATINFSGTEDVARDSGNFTRSEPAVEVAFADTYTGQIPVSFRFRLPRDSEAMWRIHEEFRSFDNMVDSLLTKNARDVMVNTAQQYTGEEFFQGGLNQYKVQLTDQLQNGIYETRRTQVVVEDVAAAAVSSTNSDATSLQETQRKVWKNVIQRDEDDNPKRLDSPLAAYNIVATQATIGKPEPSPRLNNLLENKRELVATRIAAIEQLQTAEAQAAAVQQQEEIEKRKQIQIAQRQKELAVIAQQQEVAVAREEAIKQTVVKERDKALAVIEKQKELEIAQAERDIQEANAVAAKFEAEAIREKGLAEADVDRAKLQAKQDAADIYMAEIQRDIAKVMYPALKGVTIDMPDFYYGGGNNTGDQKAPTTLDIYGTLATMDYMKGNAPQGNGPRVNTK